MKKYYLLKDKKEFLIDIERKNIKNYNIRILPDNKIKCSVPMQTIDEEISKFLKSKESWIYKHNVRQEKLQPLQNKDILKNGGFVKILGHFYNVKIESSQSFKIVLNDRNIIFYTNQIDNIDKKYRNFARKNMQEYFEKVIETFYPIIRKYNKPKPLLKIRKMKTCWGTSNPEQNVITLNEYLYSASPYCIEYIVLHELTHFLYKNHDKQFFNFISIHMPDWQERKNKLNTDFNV